MNKKKRTSACETRVLRPPYCKHHSLNRYGKLISLFHIFLVYIQNHKMQYSKNKINGCDSKANKQLYGVFFKPPSHTQFASY